MLPAIRKKEILEYIQKKPSVTVTELSETFDVSVVTIRKYLNELSEEGVIERTHGGAMSIHPSKQEDTESEKEIMNISLKQEIAQKAIRYIEDGDTVILDAGSTTWMLAKLIAESSLKQITIITNAFNIADVFRENTDFGLIFLGGQYREKILSCVGPYTLDMLRQLYADKVFFGTNGMSIHHGITTPNPLEADGKKGMIKSGREVYLLADSSKYGKVFLAKTAEMKEINYLITDSGLNADIVRDIQNLGVNVR